MAANPALSIRLHKPNQLWGLIDACFISGRMLLTEALSRCSNPGTTNATNAMGEGVFRSRAACGQTYGMGSCHCGIGTPNNYQGQSHIVVSTACLYVCVLSVREGMCFYL